MEKKFILKEMSSNNRLMENCYRIEAARTFQLATGKMIEAGTLGGWVSKEANLSQEGCAWIEGDAMVLDDAVVAGDAVVRGSALVCDDAIVDGSAEVAGGAVVCGQAHVGCCARLAEYIHLCEDAEIFSSEDLFFVSPIGQYKATFFRRKNGEIGVYLGYSGAGEFFEYLERFEYEAGEWNAPYSSITLRLCALAQESIALGRKDLKEHVKNEACRFIDIVTPEKQMKLMDFMKKLLVEGQV